MPCTGVPPNVPGVPFTGFDPAPARSAARRVYVRQVLVAVGRIQIASALATLRHVVSERDVRQRECAAVLEHRAAHPGAASARAGRERITAWPSKRLAVLQSE